jgi:hypothetical protein
MKKQENAPFISEVAARRILSFAIFVNPSAPIFRRMNYFPMP